MEPRERVICALSHEEPDRVPIFFGSSLPTSIHIRALQNLKDYMGINKPSDILSRSYQMATVDEEIQLRFSSDGRMIIPGPFPTELAREISDTEFIDEFGVGYVMKPGTMYFETNHNPLHGKKLEDIFDYPWPDLANPIRFNGLREKVQKMRRDSNYAIIGESFCSIFEVCFTLRGLEAWFVDLVENLDFVHALLQKITSMQMASAKGYLEEVGDSIDLVGMGDDLGNQLSTLISPSMYRKIIKPYHAQLIETIKNRTKAKVVFHSDGNIYAIIPDLIEIGVDVINPVQVSAKVMSDTAKLKKEFGKKLSFCGGIDSQWVLPFGSPHDVRNEVRKRIKDLAPGGGYICAAVHTIQPDVPPENICALFDEAHTAGRYPINSQ